MKTYMVSYSFLDANGGGFGNCDAYSDMPLSMKVIRMWEGSMKQQQGYFQIRIMNIVLLDE